LIHQQDVETGNVQDSGDAGMPLLALTLSEKKKAMPL